MKWFLALGVCLIILAITLNPGCVEECGSYTLDESHKILDTSQQPRGSDGIWTSPIDGETLENIVLDPDDPNIMDEPWRFAYYSVERNVFWVQDMPGESSNRGGWYGPFAGNPSCVSESQETSTTTLSSNLGGLGEFCGGIAGIRCQEGLECKLDETCVRCTDRSGVCVSQSDKPTTTTLRSNLAESGEFCGGIAGIRCREGLECRLEGRFPDAGGVCVRGEVKSNESKTSFIDYYSPVRISYTPNVLQYSLPMTPKDTEAIANYQSFMDNAGVSRLGSKLITDGISSNGFIVVGNLFNPREEDMTTLYKTLEDREIPIFITSDSLLHLYHIQFDETLRIIEEKQFYDYAWNLSWILLQRNLEGYSRSDGELKEAYRRNIEFFTVALELLKPVENQTCQSLDEWQCSMDESLFTLDEYLKYYFPCGNCPPNARCKLAPCISPIPQDFDLSNVERELQLIEKHEGFEKSPIFRYKEDYSQYVPRGHYTRSEKLKNYFKALMWYGRMSFLLKESQIIKENDSRTQTLQASLIASQLESNPSAQDMWDRMYKVTAFYVGFSDDLGPYEYRDALNNVFKRGFNGNGFDSDSLWKLRAELASYRSPKIYGGTGNCEVTPGSRDSILECLEDTKGFRLMGQRYIPDSYMFQNLVNDGNVGFYSGGTPTPFTYGMTDGGPTRVFPRGLDVMSLLGSRRAGFWLARLNDTRYVNYSDAYLRLDREFANLTQADWNQNLYWNWLYSLKPLLAEFNQSYPTFMQSKAWEDKELNTALASWTELRHDTILYAKQSYTMKTTGVMPRPEKPVVGYVEPVPEFYARLLALTRMTNNGLSDMGVLDDTSSRRLRNLDSIIERLMNISVMELENKELTQEDYDFIKNFGDQLNGVIADVEEKAKKTTIVADVHTDANSRMVLEEGVGYVDTIIVAYKLPDGRILLGAGPVFTHYEFKHPMSDRLTDEKWRQLLQDEQPEKPEWTDSYYYIVGQNVDDISNSLPSCANRTRCMQNDDCAYFWYAGGCFSKTYQPKCMNEMVSIGLFMGEAPPRENVNCTCESQKCITHG